MHGCVSWVGWVIIIIITRMHYVQWPRGATCIAFLYIQKLSDQEATAQERYEEDKSIVGCSVVGKRD